MVLIASMRGLTLAAVLLVLAALPARAQSMPERLAPCLGCHGASGRSETPDVPSLGGQPSFYLTVQLLMFRERMRAVEPMTGMLQGASDDTLRAMAEALAKLPPPRPNAEEPDAARSAHTRALIQQHRCNICHRADFSGEENVPRLAGQREEYLLESLRGYKDNSRRGYDTQMADVAAPLSDADMADLAYFLARAR
jgi:cytochrome c553